MLYSYRQMRRDYKIKFTDKSKANLWIHLDLAKVHHLKGLTSLCIISYLHFLNLNNILTLPKTLVIAEAGFGLTRIMFALFFACHAFTLVYEIKTNASRLYHKNGVTWMLTDPLLDPTCYPPFLKIAPTHANPSCPNQTNQPFLV